MRACALVVLVLCLAGCGGKNAPVAAQLPGVWAESNGISQYTLALRPDHTYTAGAGSSADRGRWQQSGATLTLLPQDAAQNLFQTATWAMSPDGATLTLEAKRWDGAPLLMSLRRQQQP